MRRVLWVVVGGVLLSCTSDRELNPVEVTSPTPGPVRADSLVLPSGLVQRVEVEPAKPEFHDYVKFRSMIVNRSPDTLYVAVRECRLDLLTRASLIRAGGAALCG